MQGTECVLNSEVLGFSGLGVEELDASLLDSQLFKFFNDFLVGIQLELLTHFFDFLHQFLFLFELFSGLFFSGVACEKYFDSLLDLFKERGFILK